MASRMAIKRLTIEYKSLRESPTPYIDARPSEDDILQWYYLLTGPPDTPFTGGQYLGELKFPANYPYSPPSIRMLTPSGRFTPGARLCLNMSDFHPETWNPAWNVSTILTGLLSFMCSKEVATGAVNDGPEKQHQMATQSVKWNLKHDVFLQLFSDVADEIKASVPDLEAVSTIEVVPPKTSDLVANLGTYRATAFKEAKQRANAAAEHEKSIAEQQKPKQFGNDAIYIYAAIGVVVVATIVGGLYSVL